MFVHQKDDAGGTTSHKHSCLFTIADCCVWRNSVIYRIVVTYVKLFTSRNYCSPNTLMLLCGAPTRTFRKGPKAATAPASAALLLLRCTGAAATIMSHDHCGLPWRLSLFEYMAKNNMTPSCALCWFDEKKFIK
jgi:hypothetical protein